MDSQESLQQLVANLSLTEAQIETPVWDEGRVMVHEWRTHVPYGLRVLWPELSREAKLAIIFMAEQQADNEHWD